MTNMPEGYHLEGGLRVKYELAWNPDENATTLIRSVYAGVSGPGPVGSAASREDAERFAFDHGKVPAGDWTVHATGHYVPLTNFKGQ